jgi:hypothetical protein
MSLSLLEMDCLDRDVAKKKHLAFPGSFFSEAAAAIIFSSLARCIKIYSNNGPQKQKKKKKKTPRFSRKFLF